MRQTRDGGRLSEPIWVRAVRVSTVLIVRSLRSPGTLLSDGSVGRLQNIPPDRTNLLPSDDGFSDSQTQRLIPYEFRHINPKRDEAI
jgi:hypothetical protein